MVPGDKRIAWIAIDPSWSVKRTILMDGTVTFEDMRPTHDLWQESGIWDSGVDVGRPMSMI